MTVQVVDSYAGHHEAGTGIREAREVTLNHPMGILAA